MSLTTLLAAVAARGGLRVWRLIVIVSVLLALVVGMKSMAVAYTEGVSQIRQLAGQPSIAYSTSMPGNVSYVQVSVAHVDVQGHDVVLVSADNLTLYMKLHGVHLEGSMPKPREALIGEKVEFASIGSSVSVYGKSFNISGVMCASDYLAYSILLRSADAVSLDVNWTVFYEWPASEGGRGTCVPSFNEVLSSSSSNILWNLRMLTSVVYVVAFFTCFFLSSSSAMESRRVFKTLVATGFEHGKLCTSLVVLSSMLSLIALLVGTSVGILAPTVLSATVSIALRLPYVRPELYSGVWVDELLFWLASTAGFSAGFLRGLGDVSRP